MKINPNDKRNIYLTAGTASMMKDGEKIPVNTIPYTDPACGCGPDCCYGMYILPNYNSTTGKSIPIALYFVDGAPIYNTVENAQAAIRAIKALNV